MFLQAYEFKCLCCKNTSPQIESIYVGANSFEDAVSRFNEFIGHRPSGFDEVKEIVHLGNFIGSRWTSKEEDCWKQQKEDTIKALTKWLTEYIDVNHGIPQEMRELLAFIKSPS